MPRVPPSELALVALAAAAFATASPLAKAAHGISFAPMATARCAVAAVGLLLATQGATGGALAKLPAKQRLALLGAGALLAAHFAFFLLGLLTTSLAAAAALVSLEPIAVVVAVWLAFGERPTRREVAGLLLAMAGAIVVACGAGQGEHRLLGDALVLVAVALFGAYVAFARGLRGAMSTTPYAACVYTVAALMLAPVALLTGGPSLSAPMTSWLAVLALGLLPTLVGHTLLQRGARHVPAFVVALACPGETVGSILIGAATGHPPSATEWLGAALVVLGATVAVVGSSSTTADASPAP